MRWDREVESKLKEYPHRKKSLNNMEDRINYLESEKYNIKPSLTDKEPIKGGSTKQEDIVINRMMEIEELQKNIVYAKREIDWIDKGLEALDDIERKIIYKMYIVTPRISIRNICEELGYEKSQVYDIKNKAIYKMTISLYGRLYS